MDTKALEKVLFSMSPDDVIETISNSGLRGRGGAGFPTGKNGLSQKWHKEIKNMWYVMPTREILEHLWTEVS